MPSSPPWLRAVLAAAIASSLAACASEQPHRNFHHGGEGEGRRGAQGGNRPSLFISPAGQPFRAASGDPYPVAAWFAAADADHDGRLTREEFRRDASRFFDQLDVNHDGVVDGPEITVYEHTIAPEILVLSERPGGTDGGQSGAQPGGGRMGGGMGRGMGRHGGRGQSGGSGGSGQSQARLEGAAPYSLIAVVEPVTSADADFDGKVTRQEFLAAADRRFAELDKAGGGFLTLAGLPKTPAQASGRRRQADHAD